MSLSSLYMDLKKKCKIKNKITDWKKNENEFKIIIYFLENNINVEKEKELLNNLYQKHGLSWTAFDPREVKKIILIKKLYDSILLLVLKNKSLTAFFRYCNFLKFISSREQ